MKDQIRISMIAAIAAVAATASSSPPATAQTTAQAKAGRMPAYGQLKFVKNVGQWNRHVRFLGQAPGVDMWVTDSGVTYDYYKNDEKARKGHTVRISFPGGASAKATNVVGLKKQSGTMSYFIGSDRSKWVSGAPVYDAATIKDLYKGIDLVAYFDKARKMPRYDLVVHPGANPDQIAMRYSGADRLRLAKGGALGYGTSLGRVEERELLAYQPAGENEIGRLRDGIASGNASTRAQLTKVGAKVKIGDDGLVRFALNQSNRSKPLVIDPLVWSTFFGDSGADRINSVTSGPDGNIFLCGQTSARSVFTTTTGAYTSPKSSNSFVSKLSANGSSLLYSAIVGGDTGTGLGGLRSAANSIAVDSTGCAFVCGNTTCYDFPTVNALEVAPPFINGISPQGMTYKLSPDGSTLRFSTYIRGDDGNSTVVNAIAVDSTGAPVMVGVTSATNLITDGFPIGTTADPQPGFCIKLAADGSRVQFATYIAGTDTNGVTVGGVALDPVNNVYVTGTVNRPATFPTTPGAFEPATFVGDYSDARIGFVTKIAADGSRFVYSTLLGPMPQDWVYNDLYGIAVDATGAAYVVGMDAGNQFPTTPGALKTSNLQYNGMTISKLSSDGSRLIYSTYFGGDEGAIPDGHIFVDNTGAVTFSGEAYGFDFPITPGAIEPYSFTTVEDTPYGPFIAKVSANGSSLLYSSFFGARSNTTISGIAKGPVSSSVYIVGNTGPLGFPWTPGVYKPDQGSSRAFVSRLDLIPGVSISLSASTIAAGDAILGTVSLGAPASDTTFVTLTSTKSLTVPSFTVVPKGQMSAGFPVVANTSAVTTAGVVFAKVGAVAQYGYAAVQILPSAEVKSFEATPTSVIGGATNTTLKITLRIPAGANGCTVKILNSRIDALDLPAQSTILIPSGKTAYTLVVKSKAVASDTVADLSYIDDKGVTMAGPSITVRPVLVTSLAIGPAALVPGNTYVGKVTISTKAPTPQTVTLTSSSANVTVPAQVTVPTGSTSATFDVLPKSEFAGPAETVTVTASVPGGQLQKTATLAPTLPTKLSFGTTTLYGSQSTAVTVRLSQAAPTGGLTVPITSSAGGYPVVTTEVTVPEGAAVGTGQITLPITFSGADEVVTLSAKLHGATASANLTVKALKIATATVSPTLVKGGAPATFVITFNGAPSVNMTISLSSDSASVILPSSVVLPAGQKSISIPMTTKAVSAAVVVHIVVTANGSSATGALRMTK